MVDIFKCNTKELKALVEYKAVVEKEGRFSKDFWTKEKFQFKGPRIVCKILTRYCLENIEEIEPSDLPKYNLKQLKAFLVKNKLFGMVQRVFSHDILAIIKNAYPEEFRTKLLRDWMWSKHGIWHDDDAIIEAVQDMVRKEGIRRIEDIPQLDWKKRLLKHKIYNVLSYFNWSIYALFNFVYPNKFHKADFKYKTKWAAAESLENAFYYMHKTFKSKRYSINDILMLGTADFRRLGLAGMLIGMFGASALKAKEYYLYKTIDNEDNRKELIHDINELVSKRRDTAVKKRLSAVAVGGYIYNLHNNYTLYGYVKRHAKVANMSINDFITSHGYVYKSARKDAQELNSDEIWNLRRQGLTYIQIAKKLDSNPTTINEFCQKHFGGDPLIPRPINDYITVQELMNSYHVDHKTVMKLVSENKFESYMTIRLRYLKKSEIIPQLEKYIQNSRQHKSMILRYAK